MSRSPRSTPRRILVIRYRFIGDTVLSVPFLKQLRQAYPDAKIDYLAGPESAQVLSHCPYIDELLTFDTTRKHQYDQASQAKPTSFWRYVWLLRKRGYDRAYVLKRSFSSAALAALAGIPERIGFDTEKRGFLLTQAVPYPNETHEADAFLSVLQASGIAVSGVQRLEAWWPKPVEEHIAEQTKAFNGARNLVIHASASNALKQWPLERFARLMSSLFNEHRFESHNQALYFHAVGAPRDAAIYAKLKSYLPEPMRQRLIIWCGEFSLLESFAFLKRMDGVIGVDSGTLHMAAAVGTPVVAVFGPMDPERWGPYGQPSQLTHQIVQHGELACQPCHLKEPCQHNAACLNDLSVDAVKQASLPLLKV